MIRIHLQGFVDTAGIQVGQLINGILLQTDNIRIGIRDVFQYLIRFFLGITLITKGHNIIGQNLQGILPLGNLCFRMKRVITIDRPPTDQKRANTNQQILPMAQEKPIKDKQ